MNVCYLGPLKDYSGYGQACRNYVAALDTAGVTVLPELVTYSSQTADFGALGARIEPLYGQDVDYRIKVLHTTPNVFKRHMEPGKYHIAHFFWETDLIPDDFAKGLELCDEIWTGSAANAAAIQKAGVTKPVHVFPQAIDTMKPNVKPYVIQNDGTPFDGLLFYSIFEWTDRKNPEALLNSYWKAFQGGENVGLLLKTYFRDFTLPNKRMIRSAIQRMQSRSGLDKFPPVFLYSDLMDSVQIQRLHETGDVFVSTHRGEGWGVPQVEAAIAGNAVMSTGYGGCHEYFDAESMIKFGYLMVPVRGMDHSADWYNRSQKWADVEDSQVVDAFRWAYERPAELKQLAKAGRDVAATRFSFDEVGELLARRLQAIEERL